MDSSYEWETADQVCALTGEMFRQVKALEDALAHVPAGDKTAQSMYYKDKVLTVMAALRSAADQLETLTDAGCWPYPTYGDLLFGVR